MITIVGTVFESCRGAKHPDSGRDATVGQPAPRLKQA
jgi:hypothetical protein